MEERIRGHWPEDRRFYELEHFKAQAGKEKKKTGEGMPGKSRPDVVESPIYGGTGSEKGMMLQENEAYEPGIGKYTLSVQELKRYGATDQARFRNYNQQEKKPNWSNYNRPDYKPDNHLHPDVQGKESSTGESKK